MFQITKYLQFRNTPDGKPRVLVEGVDYNTICDEFIIDVTLAENLEDKSFYFIGKTNIIANLSDCRPLLSVEINGEIWTEGDIFEWRPYGSYSGDLSECNPNFFSFYVDKITKEIKNYRDIKSGYKTQSGSFFDDPAKYSKLLWNCDEKEGWKRVFELLEIDKNKNLAH